ncbi:MAG TPA: M20 family peptidase [Thermoanaerobaculia bacterium]
MKKILSILGLALLILIAIVLVRTAMVQSRQISAEPVTDLPVDAQAAAARLAGAIRFPTISHEEGGRVEREAFLGLHQYLARSFPRTHAALTREVVADYSLLYTWKGQNPSLPPILLMSHLDVVPVEPGTERSWTHPPFAGRIADGYVWGRGSMDDKVSVLGILEGVEMLLGRGFQPERTVLLAFGHDEEIGGLQGARNLAALLERRGIRPQFILDEGGVIAEKMVPGVAPPVAMIGTAEKGYANVALTAKNPGGHSSMPPPHTAIGLVSAAIVRLEENPMPTRIDGATERSFEYLAPEMPFFPRMILANLWLFGPVAERQFASEPAGNARIRTTTAATMIRGGVKENVLPLEARAVVNFRILPGDTVEGVMRHVRELAGPGVEVSQAGHAADPSPESDVRAPSFELLQRTIAQTLPGTFASPNLLGGATDTKHFQKLTRNIYRFIPIRATEPDMVRFHGTNERVSVENYGEIVRFYAQLLRNAAGR